jgi:hypothetical protein
MGYERVAGDEGQGQGPEEDDRLEPERDDEVQGQEPHAAPDLVEQIARQRRRDLSGIRPRPIGPQERDVLVHADEHSVSGSVVGAHAEDIAVAHDVLLART